MSLSSMLKGKSEKEIQLQNILKNLITPRPSFATLSGKKAFSEEYEDLAPYNLSNPYYSTLVGMAFEYLVRLIVAKNLKNDIDKTPTYSRLMSGIAFKFLGRTTDRSTMEVLKRKYRDGQKACEAYTNRQECDFDEILNFAGYLASLEAIVRSGGIPPNDINKSLVEDTNKEIVESLRTLSRVFEEKFIGGGILKENSTVIFNPAFSPLISLCCSRAYGDMFIDGTLYSFKCNKSKGYSWTECAQMIGHYLLTVIDLRYSRNDINLDEDTIERLAFYRSRCGEIEYMDIKSFDKNKVEKAIEELIRLWGLEFE